MNEVKEHTIKETITVEEIVPEHEQRKASAEFERNRKRIIEDGHAKCWVCGCTDGLEAHHHGAEWCEADNVDFDLLKEYLEEHDIYGYGRLLKSQPITSVDDIRNLMMLCKKHHTAALTGIHETPYPIFLTQKLCKKGVETI